MATEQRNWVRRRSIRTRVTLAASAVLALALVVAAFTLVGLERRSLIGEIDRNLNDRMAGLIQSARLGQLGPDVPVTGRETGVVQIIDTSDDVLAATPGLHTAPVLNQVNARVDRVVYRSVGGLNVFGDQAKTWRIAGLEVDSNLGPVFIYAATTTDGVTRLLHRLGLLFLGGIPILEVLLIFVVWRSVGWALAPVDSLTRQVDQIQSEQLDQTLGEPGTGDEIDHLASTMNGLLARLNESRQRERRFAADASHELRSPLAAARLGIEVALAHPDRADWTATAHDTLAELDRLEQLARDLLELTRLDPARTMAAAVPVELQTLVRTECDTRTAGHDRLTYTVHTVAATVNGVTELILRAVRNVLDNAERHAASTVTVTLVASSSSAILTVANDGPPVPSSDRERAFQPFVRLDESRSVDDGGTGLGLAIVADIMRAMGGQARFVDPPVGLGAALELSFPVVTTPAQALPPPSRSPLPPPKGPASELTS